MDHTKHQFISDGIKYGPLEELLIATEVANSTDAGVDIRNTGVLMFTERPDKLIPGAQIDLVRFNTEEAEASDDFKRHLLVRYGNR